MNKVVLIGRLTKDPDLRFTPGQGKAVTRITVAVDRSYEAKDGIRKYVTEVIADEVQFLDWGKKSEKPKDNFDLPDGVTPEDDGEIPF